tara:strand:- start:556 stop:1920 length:1365 start_codon:yes stop_codon:yes gene_type:complete
MDINLGKKLLEQKKLREAENCLIKLLNDGNKSSRLMFLLGFTYFELNQFNESIKFYKKALKVENKNESIMLNLAHAEQTIGNIKTAKNLYLKILKNNDLNIRAYYGLFTLNPFNLKKNDFQNIQRAIKKNKNKLYENSLAEFLISKNEKNEQNYKKEMIHLEQYHLNCFKSNESYNQQGLYYYNNIISQIYSKLKFTNDQTPNNLKNINPIFIIGLPRSGSTLVETMLTSSEDKVYSFGESSIFNVAFIEQLNKAIFDKNFSIKNYSPSIDVKKISENITENYNKFINLSNNEFNSIVDKSLENFFNIEVILKVFPNAKFIHCKRNLYDSVIAIYQAMLPNLPWTHSVSDIINYVDNYIKTIKYFEKKYQNNILSVDLKKLSNDKINISKEIFLFCNLNWSPKILDFYKRHDLNIKTLSNTQLRNKIVKYNDNQYKSYSFILDSFKNKFNWIKY